MWERRMINIRTPDTGISYEPGDIPRDVYQTYLKNRELYEQLGKPAPRHYDETVPGQVTVTSYAKPEVSRTYEEPVGEPLTFSPATLQPVVDYGIKEAGFGGLLAGIGGAIGGLLNIPEPAIAGATTAIQAYEAGKEPQNGGKDMAMVRNGGYVPVSGPGVPEPPREMVAKQWKVKSFSKTAGEYWIYFFQLIDGRIMCYNGAKNSWKMWRPKKPIVLYRGSVTLSQAVKAQSMLDKLWRRVAKRTKALKLA